MKAVRLIPALVLALTAIVVCTMSPSTPAQAAPAPVPAEMVTPAELVGLQYRDLLGRRADPAGREFWASAVASGTPISSVIESFLGSAEVGGAYDPTIRLYRAVFLRPPDSEGLAYWVRNARNGTSMKTIANAFAQSTEFTRRYGSLSDAEFVDLIYRNVLDRRADHSGRQYWQSLLARGVTRGELVLAFSEAAENQAKTSVSTRKSLLTATLLRRVPTRQEIARWEARPASVSTTTLINEVLRSAEYRARLGRLFPARHPLTGQATASVAQRPALAVKIDNVDAARPHIGLSMADIVYEEMVEGNLTRLIGLYHSQSPATVGPVRSVRVSDFDVLTPFNRPLLAASGANPGVLQALKSAPVVNVNALVVSDYWRDRSRTAPNNMLTSPEALWKYAPAGAGPPPVMVRTGRPASSGGAVSGAEIEFGRASVAWHWDAGAGVWRRSQNGTAHTDALGNRVGAENLIIMVTAYTPNAIDAQSPEAHTVGESRAIVFTDGTAIDARWRRSKATDPIRYTTKSGKPITLRPGQTWIELAPPVTTTLLFD